MFVVRVLANWAASYKLLGYVLDIPSISEQELKVLMVASYWKYLGAY